VLVTTTTGADQPGLANLFDASGDTLLAQANLGNGPIAQTVTFDGATAITSNSDGTLSSYFPNVRLLSNQINTTTLSGAPGVVPQPINMLATAPSGSIGNLFVTLPTAPQPSVAVLIRNETQQSANYLIQQELPVAASPVNVAGNSDSSRVYAISQDDGSNQVAFGDCEDPTHVTGSGQVASIEVSSLTISKRLPVGICPVYGVSSTDDQRTFILNRGSGTVSVINSQLNVLDNTTGRQNLNPANGQLTLPPPAGYSGPTFKAGPVFADYYAPTSQLVTANYDSNTISIINTSLDAFGNDGPQFGQTVTVPVGNGPDALTILRDGSRVYVANQKDGTISVVNLGTYQVEATIPVTGHPISIASVYSTPYGQVYVVSSDQPYMTVIRTDTDQVSASLELDGTGVDVRATAQESGAKAAAGSIFNAITDSHASGSGAPCGFGAVYYLPSGPCSLLTSQHVSTQSSH
jgi:YVTN family beta-propeller protein